MRKRAFLLLITGFFMGQSLHAGTSSVSFELVKGIIIVQASLNGTTANYILDTGSPMMVVNDNSTILYGQNEWKTIENFNWAGIERRGINAIPANLSHLERMTQWPIAGIIGYEFLKGFELALDFESQTAILIPSSGEEKLVGWVMQGSLPFNLVGHLPVIQVDIGGKKLSMGLDTGSNTNILNAKLYDEISIDFKFNESSGEALGIFGMEPVLTADVVGKDILGESSNYMQFVFADFTTYPSLEHQGVDGLLGFPFFKSGKFSINYNTMELTVWK